MNNFTSKNMFQRIKNIFVTLYQSPYSANECFERLSAGYIEKIINDKSVDLYLNRKKTWSLTAEITKKGKIRLETFQAVSLRFTIMIAPEGTHTILTKSHNPFTDMRMLFCALFALAGLFFAFVSAIAIESVADRVEGIGLGLLFLLPLSFMFCSKELIAQRIIDDYLKKILGAEA